MRVMVLLVPCFLVAYLAGVFGLIWFDLHVLDLGDPKFKTSVDIYFPLWSAFYSPAVLVALALLWLSKQHGWRLWQLAGMFLSLIFVALEISFVLDAGLIVVLLEFLMLGILFWKIQEITQRSGNAQ